MNAGLKVYLVDDDLFICFYPVTCILVKKDSLMIGDNFHGGSLATLYRCYGKRWILEGRSQDLCVVLKRIISSNDVFLDVFPLYAYFFLVSF